MSEERGGGMGWKGCMGRVPVQDEHSSLGYAENGEYRCGCGELIGKAGSGPIEIREEERDREAGGNSTALALKDQWRAHQREKRGGSDE